MAEGRRDTFSGADTGADEEPTVHGTRILLLEDDRETRWALATVLRREGARVTEGANGDEGLRFLARGEFDLCISDVCMPLLGGFGFFAAVRFGNTEELRAHRNLPIVLVSGKVPTRELAQALDAGVDDFMEKPVDPEEFKARGRAVLRRSRATSPMGRTSGHLADFGMAALAQALHLGARNARLRVIAGPVSAMLDFRCGQIRHALYEANGQTVKGDDAAVQAIGLTKGTFEILPLPDTGPSTVFEDTTGIVLRAATELDAEAMAFQPAGRRNYDEDEPDTQTQPYVE